MSSERQRIHADFMLDELKDKAREWGDLVKENRRLKELEQEHQRINGELREENKRLNNIINELEKWCLSWKENDKYCYLASNDKDKCRYDIWEEVLDKLQELKGEDKE